MAVTGKKSSVRAARQRKYSGATRAPHLTVTAATILQPLVDAAAKLEAVDGVCRVKDAFEGGATRSTQEVRFDLVPPAAVRALAHRLTLGAARHGERNWESGGEGFRQATVSHLMAHLLAYMDNPNQEDADALICNAAFLCNFEAKRKAGL